MTWKKERIYAFDQENRIKTRFRSGKKKEYTLSTKKIEIKHAFDLKKKEEYTLSTKKKKTRKPMTSTKEKASFKILLFLL